MKKYNIVQKPVLNIVQKLVTRQLFFYLKAEEIHLDPTSQHSAKQIPTGLNNEQNKKPHHKKVERKVNIYKI